MALGWESVVLTEAALQLLPLGGRAGSEDCYNWEESGFCQVHRVLSLPALVEISTFGFNLR